MLWVFRNLKSGHVWANSHKIGAWLGKLTEKHGHVFHLFHATYTVQVSPRHFFSIEQSRHSSGVALPNGDGGG